VGKIRIFLNWLSQTWTMEGATLSDLYEIYRPEEVEAKIS
jgi:hypothetical protein